MLFVVCVVISWWFCCIYTWLDPGAYMIARFMFLINRVWHAYIQQNHQDITTHISKQKRINYKWISLLQPNQESVQGMRKHKINTWKVGRHRDINWETTPRNRRVRWCSSPRRRVLSSSRRHPKENRRVEKASVSTQLVLNKYNTNYEALGLADSSALAFNLGKFY
jgi:hypothetical protein